MHNERVQQCMRIESSVDFRAQFAVMYISYSAKINKPEYNTILCYTIQYLAIPDIQITTEHTNTVCNQ